MENKEDYFMESNVFISGIQINDINKGGVNYQQMSINYCDKNGDESSFLTSIMPENSMEQYQNGKYKQSPAPTASSTNKSGEDKSISRERALEPL